MTTTTQTSGLPTMNDTRAEWAAAVLTMFRLMTGTDREDCLCDLLCDLMHWATRNGFDFAAEMGRASSHYGIELIEDN